MLSPLCFFGKVASKFVIKLAARTTVWASLSFEDFLLVYNGSMDKSTAFLEPYLFLSFKCIFFSPIIYV